MAIGKYQEWLKKENVLRLEAWARNGLTDEDIAKNMDISTTTLYDWKKKYPKIAESLKKGKEYADIVVENALYQRAIGYSYEEKTYEKQRDKKTGRLRMTLTKRVTKHVSPDTTAQIYWLNNRKPIDWRNKREIEITSNNDLANVLNKAKEHKEQVVTAIGEEDNK